MDIYLSYEFFVKYILIPYTPSVDNIGIKLGSYFFI